MSEEVPLHLISEVSLQGGGPSLIHRPGSGGFELCVRPEVYMHSLAHSRQCVGLRENW